MLFKVFIMNELVLEKRLYGKNIEIHLENIVYFYFATILTFPSHF